MTESILLKFICANQGSVRVGDLKANYGFYNVKEIISNRKKFVLSSSGGEQKVVAKTELRLCRAKECQSCNNLHLCKKFLLGSCQFSQTRRGCCFSHQLTSDHNVRILKDHGLEDLDKTELCTLLLQNDNFLLPPVCFDYNHGDGPFGRCPDGNSCTRVHICEKYLQGPCSCPRAHDFNESQPFNSLWRRGVPDQLIHSMKSLYFNKEALRSCDSRNKDKTEICLYFIKGHCQNGERCRKAHNKLPYGWEVRQDQQWTALPNCEQIEKDYCDPQKTYSFCGSQLVCFDTMTCGLNTVRRLSTASSVLYPNFVLTTEWLWYWEDEFGNWNLYAASTDGHGIASVSSAELEQKYLNNDKDVVEFTAGSQKYLLNFQDMIQTNQKYGTKRLVRRRPAFVSSADAEAAKVRRPQSDFRAVPAHWDKTQIPETGYKRVSLQRSSAEFNEIEALFCNTMGSSDILQIERIQNKALWEFYQSQKNFMKKNNGGRHVTEKKLFHGTDSKHVDAICHDNFDWRICGTHGTTYGKGSYFARDAEYSHSFTGQSDVKSMFVSRVLVGDFTQGFPNYVRPPSKVGSTHFYDSCVDDVSNPSIFVVFEKHQIYPEYLLQYVERTSYYHQYYGAAAAPVAGAVNTAPTRARTVPTSVTPVRTPVTPVSTSVTPVRTPVTPVSTSVTPVRTPVTPVSTSVTPVRAPVKPVSTSVTPVRAPVKPVSTSVTPVRAPVTPVSTSVTPVRAPVKPVSTSVTPVRAPVKPVSTSATQTSTYVRAVVATMEACRSQSISNHFPTSAKPVPAPIKPVQTTVKPVPAPVKPVLSTVKPVPAPVKPVPAPVKPVPAPVKPVPTTVKPVTTPVALASTSVKAAVATMEASRFQRTSSNRLLAPFTPAPTLVKQVPAPVTPVNTYARPVVATMEACRSQTAFSYHLPNPVTPVPAAVTPVSSTSVREVVATIEASKSQTSFSHPLPSLHNC